MHDASISDIDRLLPVNLQAAPFQFACQNKLIDAFQQARTEIAMDTDAGINHLS